MTDFYVRKPYTRVSKKFNALLTKAGQRRFAEIVVTTDADWYVVAAAIFDMGLDAWERQAEELRAKEGKDDTERD